jgi:hypothetical protein
VLAVEVPSWPVQVPVPEAVLPVEPSESPSESVVLELPDEVVVVLVELPELLELPGRGGVLTVLMALGVLLTAVVVVWAEPVVVWADVEAAVVVARCAT